MAVIKGDAQSIFLGGWFITQAAGGSEVYPAVGDVQEDAGDYGPTGAEYTPTRVDCPVALAVLGTAYGDAGSLIGTHTDTLSFTSSDPADLFLPSVIRTALLTSARLTGYLAPYDFGDGDEPAAFTNDRFLYMARRPLIHIEQTGASAGQGDRASRAYDAQLAVRVWGDRRGSDATIYALAQEVWHLIDRLALTLTGGSVVGISAGAPDRIDDEYGFPGYQVPCEINLIEE